MNNEEKILSMLETMTTKIDNLEQGQNEIKEDMQSLKTDMQSLKTDVKRLDRGQKEIKAELVMSTGLILDEIERRIDFEKWQDKQKFNLQA